MVGCRVEVGEVATSATGNEDFSGGLGSVVQNEHFSAAGRGLGGAHQAGSSGSNNEDIGILHGDRVPVNGLFGN